MLAMTVSSLIIEFMSIEHISTGPMAGKDERLRKSVGQKPSNYNSLHQLHVFLHNLADAASSSYVLYVLNFKNNGVALTNLHNT